MAHTRSKEAVVCRVYSLHGYRQGEVQHIASLGMSSWKANAILVISQCIYSILPCWMMVAVASTRHWSQRKNAGHCFIGTCCIGSAKASRLINEPYNELSATHYRWDRDAVIWSKECYSEIPQGKVLCCMVISKASLRKEIDDRLSFGYYYYPTTRQGSHCTEGSRGDDHVLLAESVNWNWIHYSYDRLSVRLHHCKDYSRLPWREDEFHGEFSFQAVSMWNHYQIPGRTFWTMRYTCLIKTWFIRDAWWLSDANEHKVAWWQQPLIWRMSGWCLLSLPGMGGKKFVLATCYVVPDFP